MPGISERKLNPPEDEIKQARWVPTADILDSKDGKLYDLNLGVEILKSVQAAVKRLGCEKVLDKGWMQVYVSGLEAKEASDKN